MKGLADVIIFDSPPVLAVADASILGALCSGVILVVDAGRTRSDVVRRSKDTLDQVGLKVLGIVLNKFTARHAGGYYYYYYYYYSHADGERRHRRRKGGHAGANGFGPWVRLKELVRRTPPEVRSTRAEEEDE
jgi:Mrp family chromosome partitioning ATPase